MKNSELKEIFKIPKIDTKSQKNMIFDDFSFYGNLHQVILVYFFKFEFE